MYLQRFAGHLKLDGRALAALVFQKGAALWSGVTPFEVAAFWKTLDHRIQSSQVSYHCTIFLVYRDFNKEFQKPIWLNWILKFTAFWKGPLPSRDYLQRFAGDFKLDGRNLQLFEKVIIDKKINTLCADIKNLSL